MPIELSYTERTYSPKKFLTYIEKRVRKDIRLNKDIEPLDTIYLLDDGSKEFFVAKHFLENVFGPNLTVKTTKKKVKGKLVIPTNMERWLSEHLQAFLENTDKIDDGIYLLDNVLEEEIVEICKILGKKAKIEEKVHPLIEKMQEKYPHTKFSLLHSFSELQPVQESSKKKAN